MGHTWTTSGGDHMGEDWTISTETSIEGTHYNIGYLTVNQDVTLNCQHLTELHTVETHIYGTIHAVGSTNGGTGGGGGVPVHTYGYPGLASSDTYGGGGTCGGGHGGLGGGTEPGPLGGGSPGLGGTLGGGTGDNGDYGGGGSGGKDGGDTCNTDDEPGWDSLPGAGGGGSGGGRGGNGFGQTNGVSGSAGGTGGASAGCVSIYAKRKIIIHEYAGGEGTAYGQIIANGHVGGNGGNAGAGGNGSPGKGGGGGGGGGVGAGGGAGGGVQLYSPMINLSASGVATVQALGGDGGNAGSGALGGTTGGGTGSTGFKGGGGGGGRIKLFHARPSTWFNTGATRPDVTGGIGRTDSNGADGSYADGTTGNTRQVAPDLRINYQSGRVYYKKFRCSFYGTQT